MSDNHGGLYNLIYAQEKRIAELKQALERLISVASQCDGWEFFPSDELDAATAVLQESSDEHSR